MITDPEQLVSEKAEELRDLSRQLADSGRHAGDFYERIMLEDNAAREHGATPRLTDHQRTYVARIVGESPTSPEERERRRLELQDAQLALEQAASRWRTWIASPDNVDRLIAMAEAGPAAEPDQSKVARWYRR